MVTFNPPTWTAAGNQMNDAADAFYRGAHGVIIARTLSGSPQSRIDQMVVQGDQTCNVPWHRLIAGATEALTVDASKALGTGNDYRYTEDGAEERAAAERFW